MENELLMWLLAGGISSGIVHPWSHVSMANKHEVPISVDYSNGTEKWNPWSTSPQNTADISAAGFSGQSQVANLMQGELGDKARKYTGVSKLLYPYIVKGLVKGNNVIDDIDGTEQFSGNSEYRKMLVGSALADMFYNTPERNISVETRNGTPVVLWNRRF